MSKSPACTSPDHVKPRGHASTGRVATITRGHGNGIIRDDHRDLFYFRRHDVLDGAIDVLRVGDAVTFEVIEDSVSGHRAAHVARKK